MHDQIVSAAGTTVTLTLTTGAAVTGTVDSFGASFFNLTNATGDTDGLRTTPAGVRLSYTDVTNVA